MKTFNPEAILYVVLCRDTDGHLWYLKGDLRNGVSAQRMPSDEVRLSPRDFFVLMAARALVLPEFKRLHNALGSKQIADWWNTTLSTHGIQLRPDTVFYRSLGIKTNVPSLIPHHKQPKLTNDLIRVCGSQVHYKKHSITFTGRTDKAMTLGVQIVKEVEKVFKLSVTCDIGREGRDSNGPTRDVELRIVPNGKVPSLNKIRKHIQEVFA